MKQQWSAVLVGAGGISHAWLDALRQRADVTIIAVADPNREAAQARIQKYELSADVFSSLAEFFAAGKRADLMFDCSIPAAHCPNAILAMEHGCHVLSEKPMAQDTHEAQKINAAARATGKLHAVIQNIRYSPAITAYRETICHTIGTLTTLNADFYLAPRIGGFRDKMKHVLLLDMAIHHFDEARFLSGCDAENVFCKEWNPSGSWYAHGASVAAIFTMTNGVVFNYRGSWCAEGCATSGGCSWRVVGTKGSALWNQQGIAGETFVKCDGYLAEYAPFTVPPTAIPAEGHAGVIKEFLDCVQNGKIPQTNGFDNIKSLAMVEAAIRSAESGGEVIIEA